MNCNPIKISSSSPPRIHPDFCFLASTAYHMMIVKTPSTSPVAWKISHLLSQFLSHLASGWQVTSSHYGHLLSGPSIRVPFLFPRWKYPFGGFKHYSTGKSDALHLDKSPNYEDQKVTVEHGDIVVEPRLMSRSPTTFSSTSFLGYDGLTLSFLDLSPRPSKHLPVGSLRFSCPICRWGLDVFSWLPLLRLNRAMEKWPMYKRSPY